MVFGDNKFEAGELFFREAVGKFEAVADEVGFPLRDELSELEDLPCFDDG